MNWKSTAAVSGAGLLATLLGWPPTLQPAGTPATETREARPVASDIAAQADRLQVRVRRELDYRDPTRNPFRFGQRRPAPAAAAERLLPVPAVALEVPTMQPLPFTLSGMATDGPDQTRTAILTAATDVVFAKEGDQVGGFTLTRVDEDGIEVTAADGTARRLTLTP